MLLYYVLGLLLKGIAMYVAALLVLFNYFIDGAINCY